MVSPLKARNETTPAPSAPLATLRAISSSCDTRPRHAVKTDQVVVPAETSAAARPEAHQAAPSTCSTAAVATPTAVQPAKSHTRLAIMAPYSSCSLGAESVSSSL